MENISQIRIENSIKRYIYKSAFQRTCLNIRFEPEASLLPDDFFNAALPFLEDTINTMITDDDFKVHPVINLKMIQKYVDGSIKSISNVIFSIRAQSIRDNLLSKIIAELLGQIESYTNKG